MRSDELKIFEHFGVTFNGGDEGNARGTCPFCSKQKLFVDKKEGKWDCKVCSKSGNKYTFLSLIHAQAVEETTSLALKKVIKQRGNLFTVEFLREKGIAVDSDGQVLFPCKQPSAKNLTNLRRWSPSTKISYNASGCCCLYFANEWVDEGPIYLCEGEWDALALSFAFSKIGAAPTVIAAPGAGVFKDKWVKQFDGREVVILYDNDDAGEQGVKKVLKRFTESGIKFSLSAIQWSKVREGLPSGYDIRDLITEAVANKKIKKTLKSIKSSLIPLDGSSHITTKMLKRESFQEVVQDFSNVYEWNQSFTDALACAFIAVVSLRFDGNPFWVHIVGPASSGKTTIIEAFEACVKQSYHLSRVKDTSLVSGFAGAGEDPSLLAKLNNLCLFIKDFTPILSMGAEAKRSVFGIFRDAYDGRYVQTYGNGTVRTYDNLHFGVVTGVTLAIHNENSSDLGERFLKINLLDDSFNHDAHIRRALQNDAEKTTHRETIQAAVCGFLKYLEGITAVPILPEKYETRLSALSQFVAFIRTNVDRKNGKDMAYRPSPEVGSRIATQLKKAGVTSALIYGKNEVDNDCYRLMTKIALDSCVSWHLELVKSLNGSSGMTASEIAHTMQVHPNQVRNITEDAMQVGTIRIERAASNRPGNRHYVYSLHPQIKRLIKKARLTFDDVIQTPSNHTKRQ